MRCQKCGRDYMHTAERCPYCYASAQYSGNTHFFKNASNETIGLSDIFSDVFRPHPKGSGAKLFIAGTPFSTPAPERMLAEWQKPWLFLRVFGIGILFCLICIIIVEAFGMLAGQTSLIIGGLFVIPVTFLVFTWELNIPRDIPFYYIIIAFLLGGMLSLFFSFVFFEFQQEGRPASWAAFAEEPGKLIAAIVFIQIFKVRYGLGGILIGAAVGCGFSVFEDIMYVMDNGNSYNIFLIRAFSLGGHYFWAACEGGAVALALNTERFSSDSVSRILSNRYFWIAFGGSLLTHFLWNSDFNIPGKGILIPVAEFALFICILKPCLKQVVDTVNRRGRVLYPQAGYSVPLSDGVITGLYCSQGYCAGTTFSLQFGTTVKVGRSLQANQIVIPSNALGVSREHFVLACYNGKWVIIDISSTSTLLNNKVMEKNRSYYLNIGDTISIGSPAHTFKVL